MLQIVKNLIMLTLPKKDKKQGTMHVIQYANSENRRQEDPLMEPQGHEISEFLQISSGCDRVNDLAVDIFEDSKR